MSGRLSSMYIHGIKNIDIKAGVIGEDYWAIISINGLETDINLNFKNKKAFDAFVEKNNVKIEVKGSE